MNENEYREFIQTHQMQLKRFTATYIRASDMIDEVVQESFILYWEKYICRETPVRNAKALLFQIARNRCIDYLRKEKIRSFFVRSNCEYNSAPSPREVLGNHEVEHKIEEAFAGLHTRDREVLELYYIERFQLNEIGAVLGLGLEAVSSRLRRARSRLKSLLPEGLNEAWSENHD